MAQRARRIASLNFGFSFSGRRLRSAVMSTHPDHNPWNGVSEDSFLYHIKAIERLAVRLDKVNHDTAITRPQDTGRNFHYSRSRQDRKSLRHPLDRVPFKTRGAPFP